MQEKIYENLRNPARALRGRHALTSVNIENGR